MNPGEGAIVAGPFENGEALESFESDANPAEVYVPGNSVKCCAEAFEGLVSTTTPAVERDTFV